MSSHLHGETPHLRDIIAVYLLAGAVGITFILSCSRKNVSDWLMALLAADLAGGIISNATASTVLSENKVSGRAAASFLRAVYPRIIIGVMGLTHTLGILMLVGCATKICLHAVPDQTRI